MNKLRIKPRSDIILIEISEELEPQKGGVILSRPATLNFEKAKVVAVADNIKDLKEGDYVYVHHGMWEALEIGGKVALVHQKDVLAIEEATSEVAN